MDGPLDNKRIFLICANSEETTSSLSSLIKKHITGTTIFLAHDGVEALMKMNNAPPLVLMVDPELSKTSKWQVIEHALADKKFKDTAIIILSPVPDEERFTDEVVVGKVQYLESLEDGAVSRSLAKAMNFISHGGVREFYLRFLAPNDVLIRQGDVATNVYLVVRGRLRAYASTPQGEKTIGYIEAGEFVGEMAYINNDKRSADVMATEDCELIEIPVGHLDKILYSKPAWTKALMATLSKRVKKGNIERLQS